MSAIATLPNMSAARDEKMFPKLEPDHLRCLAEVGDVMTLESGELVFQEGVEVSHFYAVLEGKMRITKRMSNFDQLIVIHGPGEFAGEMSILVGGKSIASGRAMGTLKVVRLNAPQFREALVQCPEMTELILPAMARRNMEVSSMLQQQEKLAALGKLSAGLAHELNNPAAAAARALGNLHHSFDKMRDKTFALSRKLLGDCVTNCVQSHALEAQAYASQARELDPLERSDREEEVGTWLDEHGFENAWVLAPTFVSAGYDVARLNDFSEGVPNEMLIKTLPWVAASVETELLLGELERSVARISQLVKAVKGYTYMDRAPFQETDLKSGLEDTLTMLSNKVKRFNLVKDYDSSLPPVCVFGAEINQVWTNLIDNACDAMEGNGTLTIRTRKDGDTALVEVEDSGPGIAPENQSRIFEAFFTTKPQGQGTGLGLDIAYRIVTLRHNGSLTFRTSPQGTTFSVRIPINQPEPAHEEAS